MTIMRSMCWLLLSVLGCTNSSSTPAADEAGPLPDATPGDAPSSDAVDAIGSDVADATAPTHVLTWDYFGGPLGASDDAGPDGVSISVAEAAKWLSWSNPAGSEAAKLHDAGVVNYAYTSITEIESDGPTAKQLVESDYLHDCSGTRVQTYPRTPPLWATDPRSAHVLAVWKKLVAGFGSDYDVIFSESANGGMGDYAAPKPCMITRAEFLAAEGTMFAGLGRPILFNGMEPRRQTDGTFAPPDLLSLLDEKDVVGAREESCFITSSPPWDGPATRRVCGSYWNATENIALTMAKKGKFHLCMSGYNTYVAKTGESYPLLLPADGSQPSRLYAISSFLLTYSLATSILAEGMTTKSRFRVEPESTIVPLHPRVPSPDDVAALATDSVYVREFDDCFVRGVRKGRCAAIVNPDCSGARPFPKTSATYAHTVVLTGGGILDGGEISVDGPPPPTTLGGPSGLIVFE